MDNKNIPSYHHKFHNRFILTTYMILLLLIVGSVIYSWQNHKVKNLTDQVSSLKTQMLSLKLHNALINTKNFDSSLITQLQFTNDTNIAPINLKLKTPSGLNLTYATTTKNITASTIKANYYIDLSSTQLSSLDKKCIANNSVDNAKGTALGIIVDGKGIGTDSTNLTIISQQKNHYIAYLKPQSSCANNSNAFVTQIGQLQLLKQSLDQYL